MSEVLKTYDIPFFENTMWGGFHFEVPQETINMISELADKVGAPNYVKTPIFTKTNNNNNNTLTQKRRRNDGGKNAEINESDWKAIRDFKATTITKSEGVQKNIDDARGYLNKISAKNYDTMRDNIIELIQEKEGEDNLTQEDTLKLLNYIFTTASSNTFCSELYAKLVVDLIAKSSVIKDLFNKNKRDFMNNFDNIEAVDPEKDYDKFCEINIVNERRRASSMFLINLMKLDVIIPQEIINIIPELQENLLTVIDEEDKSIVSEEIGENLYILITTGYQYISKLHEWETVINCVQSISKMKSKDKPSLKHKCIFRHMDILDTIKKSKKW